MGFAMNWKGKIMPVKSIKTVKKPLSRSENMAAIHSKNTLPEIKIRKALHHAGLRFRLHNKDLAGTPDIVLKKYRTVVFVHGCFWHKHDCKYFHWPKSNLDYWQPKILKNVERDTAHTLTLLQNHWKVCIWWECSTRQTDDLVWSLQRFLAWLSEPDNPYLEL